MSRSSRFLDACAGRMPENTPVWFMRQAGRYMPEYRALREKYSILEMIRNPELATEVTLQPIHAFEVDAAIIFSDILPLVDAMGLGLDFIAGEGPRFARPIQGPADLDRLRTPSAAEDLAPTLEAISMTRKALNGTVPLIGFSGAPFTLACYAIQGEGGNRFERAQSFLGEHPAAWHRLMDLLADTVLDYLLLQAEHGAQALQLFDSWAGLLTPEQYREFVHPYSARILQGLEALDIPRIHFGTNSPNIYTSLGAAGGTVLGVDRDLSLSEARALTPRVALQGNLSPQLLADGAWEDVTAATDRILEEMRSFPGHIFNTGHGILKQTDPDRVRRLTDYVHEHGGKTVPA
jgi:uroporphyrinogen decarboxylase